MTLRYGVLNLLALIIVVLLGFKNYEAWTLPIKAIPGKETTKKPSAKIENPPLVGSQKEPTSFQSYMLIAEKNIFSPERKEFPVQPSTAPEVKKPVARPQMILYGVMIADECQFASVTNPGRPLQKGERETMSLKVGERIGEYKLAKILPDRIMMEGPEDSFEVLLYDPKTPKKRMGVKTESKPAAVASTQPATTKSTQPAVAPPAPGSPVPAPPPASAEVKNPVEPVQEKVATPPPTTRPPRPSFPSLDFRRGRRMLSPPLEATTPGTPAK